MKRFKGILGLVLTSSLLLTACNGGANNQAEPNTLEAINEKEEVKAEKVKENKEPTVIRYGSHCAYEEDPYYKDPITGNYQMAEEEREIRIQALEKVKEELNVELEFVQYPGDVTEVLLQSVIAGDPICDIARIYANGQGALLSQNVLQPVDDYIDLLGENPPPKIYGKQYFIEIAGNNSHPLSPLMYNINYIEQVDALKENGKTVYPTDLYKEGRWTWSTFEEYLEKIDKHFVHIPSPQRKEQRIEAYWTDYRDVALQAMHSAGTSIYGPNGLEISTDRTKQAIDFMTNLYDRGLMKSPPREGSSKPDSSKAKDGFIKGETVFCNLEDWRSGEATTVFAERGESLGFIPFPRPDDMAFEDLNYRQVRIGGESYAIVRGVPEEKVPLAIKSFQLYNDTVAEIKKEVGLETQAIALNFDIFHPEIGQDMQEIYNDSISKTYVNEISNVLGIHVDFNDIVGRALYGLNGTPKFDVAIEAEKAIIENKVSEVETVLNSDIFVDNINPKITQVIAENYAFPVGTSPESIVWNEKFSGTDNVDGDLDMNQAIIDVSGCDFSTIGTYNPGVKVSIKDAAGNETSSKYPIVIYNPNNTTAPTLVLKEEYRKVVKDEDTAAINWANDFIESAVDADGIDLKSFIEVDLSQLDTTQVGTYTVKVTVKDYVGNISSVDISVDVE
ncbi:MAG: hypothetical protein KHY44_11710 [Clostridiales bacterium]|nr:hypothetical protein [Clostridiales bacterium]